MGIDSYKTIRTLRLTLTCLMLFLITWYYQVPERIWSLITVWFVMTEYTSVGGVYKKGLYRFMGTFMSALYGMVVIYCFENNVVINMVAFVVGVFVYMYYFLDGEKTYIAVIGSVTLSIVLLNHNDLDAAILRTFNIGLGIVSSMFMIRFFYPVYAQDELMETHAYLIQQLSSRVTRYLDKSVPLVRVLEEYTGWESNLLKAFAAFERHLSEAKIEVGEKSAFIRCNVDAMKHMRHIFRLLSVLINDLTTDATRANVEIDTSLNQVVLDLGAIEHRLTDGGLQTCPRALTSRDAQVTRDKHPLGAMLAVLHAEVQLLSEKINTLVSLCELQNVPRTRFWHKAPAFLRGMFQ